MGFKVIDVTEGTNHSVLLKDEETQSCIRIDVHTEDKEGMEAHKKFVIGDLYEISLKHYKPSEKEQTEGDLEEGNGETKQTNTKKKGK